MYMNPRFAWARFNRPLFTATVVAVAALLAGAATRAGAQSGPISIWPATAVPANPTVTDKKPIELGVKFRSDVNGFITALRFYKGPSNTGTHTGTLWTSSGTLLERVTFTNETASGWQQMTLPTPAAITANTIYVASYFAAAGQYSTTENYFTSAGVDNPPLHALANTQSVNGVYKNGSSSGFPTSSSLSTNYWVDVVFTTTSTDTTPPTVTTVAPANGATGVAATASVTATFSEVMDPTSLTSATFQLQNQSGTLVPATVTYSAATGVATLKSTGNLAAGTSYTATVRGGATGARDLAGNPLAADFVWFFTTSSPTTTTTTAPTTTSSSTTTTTTAPTTTSSSTTTTTSSSTTTTTS